MNGEMLGFSNNHKFAGSQSFLNREIKNGFIIEETRKRIWFTLLDLLYEFQRICKNYNLRYFAICGTALGAIRHNGFIPWDDDLDVAMPREDYEKLKTMFKEFKYPYSLLWPENELENGYSYIKLRNSLTTGISKAFSKLSINHGLFIDIFPLDEVKDLNNYEAEQQKIKNLIIDNSNRMKGLNTGNVDNRGRVCDMIRQTYESIEKLATKDHGKDSDYFALRTISFYPASKMIWHKNVFKEAIDMPFEFMSIKVPVGWEELLTTNYGEWRKFPPIDQRGTWHSNVILDADKPYSYYQHPDCDFSN